MKKINIIKENREFDRIIRTKKAYKYKDYVIYLERNESEIHKFGFSVGKKVGNAVTRNKIKRQIKSIIDEKNYEKGFNCIIIVKKSVLDKDFSIMKEELQKALANLNIIKEKENE